MEEAVAASLVFLMLVAFALGAYAYALPQATFYVHTGEVRWAVVFMRALAGSLAGLIEGDAVPNQLSFSFPYGVLGLAQSGNVSVRVQSGSVIYGNTPHTVFIYSDPVPAYKSTYVLDRGVGAMQAFYSDPDSAGLVYHYTLKGITYVVADQKVSLAVSDNPTAKSATVQVLVLQLSSSGPLALKYGPVTLALSSVSVNHLSYSGPLTIMVTCGLQADGSSPLTQSVRVSESQVTVLLTVVTVQVSGGS